MSSPTERTLRALRKDGWVPAVVEKWIPQARRRQDLFGFIDIIAIKGTNTLAVQATSYSNVSARVTKIQQHENLPHVLAAGWVVQVWGWRKVKSRYQARVVDFYF